MSRVLLDGELVAFARDGRPDLELLRARALSSRSSAAVRMCCFDVLCVDDHDVRGCPLLGRKAQLRELLDVADHRLVFVDYVEGRGDELLAGARALRLEGIVAKRADSPYVAGRSDHWRKIKIEETSDFVVIGIAAPSEGTFWRPGLVLARADGDGVRYVGRVAVGASELFAIEAVLPQLRRATPSCRGAGSAEVWLEPAVVVEVTFYFEPARSAASRVRQVQNGQDVEGVRLKTTRPIEHQVTVG